MTTIVRSWGAAAARWTALLALSTGVAGCTFVPQGEVGLRRVWGRIDPAPIGPGLVTYEMFSTDILRVPIRTTTVTVNYALPSKEGVNIDAVMSLIYRVRAHDAAAVIGKIGPDYEEALVIPVLRSAAADVSSRFLARDMYSSERATIEREISKTLNQHLAHRGFVIEAVLMKSITLPAGLARAIEQKLASEQDAQRMRFLIDRERLEAQRKVIEAEGVRDAQKIVAEGLTPELIQLRGIEALKELAKSNNGKVIVTDGKSPFMVDR